MYTISNLTNEILYIPPDVDIPKGGTINVELITDAIDRAVTTGQISVTSISY